MENINVLAIIQARVGSTRLPEKVLLPLGNKTVIEQVIDRVRQTNSIDELVVATSIEKSNLPLIKLCSEKGIRIFAGSEDDVLDRFFQLSKLLKPKHIVRITADCPLHDPEVIDMVVKSHLGSKSDYTSNTDPPTYPDGLDVEVFTFDVLKEAWEKAKLNSEREHVTPYIRKNEKIKKHNLKNEIDLSELRLTLDEEDDYKLIKMIFDNFADREIFYLHDILGYLKNNPEIQKINAGIMRNEGLLKSLKND